MWCWLVWKYMFMSLYLDAYIRVWCHEEQIKSAFEIPAIYRPVSTGGCRAKARRMTSRDAEREHEAVKRRVRVERDRREAMHYLLIHISLFFFIHYSSSSFSAHSSSCSSVTFILSSSFSCTVSTSQSSTPSCLTSSSPSLLSFAPLFSPSSSTAPSWSSPSSSSPPSVRLWFYLSCLHLTCCCCYPVINLWKSFNVIRTLRNDSNRDPFPNELCACVARSFR